MYLLPERLALAAAWVAFLGAAVAIAPSGEAVNIFDISFIQTIIQSPFR